jgi:hypothetical protein
MRATAMSVWGSSTRNSSPPQRHMVAAARAFQQLSVEGLQHLVAD